MHIRAAALALTATLVPFTAYAQDPPAAPPETQAQDAGGGRGGRAPEPQIRPYDRVITKEAKSDDGRLHGSPHQGPALLRDSEGPRSGRSSCGSARSPRPRSAPATAGRRPATASCAGSGAATASSCAASPTTSSPTPSTPIARAVKDANYDSILMAFNIEALGKDDAAGDRRHAAVHDRRAGVQRPHARRRPRPSTPSRSFLETRGRRSRENIEVEATHTYNNPPDAGRRGGAPAPAPAGGARTGMRPAARSVVMHYSMVKLPEKPMMPRLFDERVGYFTQSATMDYGTGRASRAGAALHHALPAREEGSERGALRAGEADRLLRSIRRRRRSGCRTSRRASRDWQPAFEAAGFKNAIIAKEAPTPKQDPDWSPEDARYSVIRWLPSTTENAVGPAHPRSAHRRDPRGGHPVLPQRHEPGARLVLRAGRPARSARADAAAARRSDGPPDRVRRRARSRPHARLPAQHEGELDCTRSSKSAIRSG